MFKLSVGDMALYEKRKMIYQLIYLAFIGIVEGIALKKWASGIATLSMSRNVPTRVINSNRNALANAQFPNYPTTYTSKSSLYHSPSDDLVSDDQDGYLSKDDLRTLIDPERVKLPIRIIINREYLITHFIGSGSDGSVYQGYSPADKNKILIFKIYFSLPQRSREEAASAFSNELKAVSILSRLEDFDESRLIIAMTKIHGETLRSMLRNASSRNDDELKRSLIDQYLKLYAEFTGKWKLVHNDISPDNVIVDENGEMFLIDFTRTVPLLRDNGSALIQSMMDLSHALDTLGMTQFSWNI